MTLKTDYKDYQFQEGETLRKYRQISNEDGTVSLEDVTSYQQEGDRFSASDINSTNAKVNELNQTVGGIKTDVSGLQSDLATHTHKSIAFSGYNPIKSTTNDTVENWKTIGTSIYSYDLKGSLIDQPTQWGTLITMVDGSNVSQIWLTRPSGYLFTRSGNQNGWSGTWKRYGAMSYDSSTNTLNITM